MVGAEEMVDAAAVLPSRGTEARRERADLRVVGRECVSEYRHQGDAAEDEGRQQREALVAHHGKARGKLDDLRV